VNAKTYIVKVTEGGEVEDVYEKTETTQTETDYGELIEISAPLAGNILNVNVSLDDNVQQGDSLLTLEAMKMETSITAPSAGRVKKIEVRPGDVCAAGQILLVISS
jgi:oxaloacetate decarboxylase alpha subunit